MPRRVRRSSGSPHLNAASLSVTLPAAPLTTLSPNLNLPAKLKELTICDPLRESVAGRDKNFGDELIKPGLEKLGSYETHQQYSELASQAVRDGDKEVAGEYVRKALEADPTYLGPIASINELALKDRAAADVLILQYIEQLRRFPLAYANQSSMRTGFGLDMLIYPRLSFLQQQQSIPPPGAAVMRAYIMYEIERIGKSGEAKLRREIKSSGHLGTAQKVRAGVDGKIYGTGGAEPRARRQLSITHETEQSGAEQRAL